MFAKLKFDLAVLPVAAALLTCLVWYTVYGPRSIEHRDELAMRIAELETIEAMVEAARVRIDGRVQLMRPESVDPDMLDELARRALDYVKPSDLVVLRGR